MHHYLLLVSLLSYDASMPRTTLTIDTDVLVAVREHARRQRKSLGAAVSDLVRRALHRPMATTESDGFQIVGLPPDSSVVTEARVKALLEDEP